MINLVVEFLAWWSVEISVLILVIGIVCWLLKEKPGSVHAAVWTTVLVLIWVIPFAPYFMPSYSILPKAEPVIVGTSMRNFPPLAEKINSQKIIPKKTDSMQQIENSLPKELIYQTAKEAPVTSHNQIKPDKSMKITIPHLLVLGWVLGFSMSLIRWIRSMKQIQRILAESLPLKDASTLKLIERTRQIFFIHDNIEVRTAPVDFAPFLLRLRKPLIFLPDFMIRQWPERDRLAVIAHELAHVLRHDLAAHHGMRLLRVLFWFLPPVWWMQRELHRAQDTACDECAAVVLESGVDFGKALTQLADYCLITNPVYPALGILHAKPSLIQRLENIMNTKLTKLSRLSFTFKFILTVASICIILLSGLVKQTVIAQTLDIEYLGNYSGGKNTVNVDNVAWFDPYYAVIGKQNGQQTVQFFTYSNKVFKLEHTTYLNKISESSNYKLGPVAVSDKYMAFSYTSNSQNYCLVYDYNQNWSFVSYPIPFTYINDMQIVDDNLYMLCYNTGNKEGTILSLNLTDKSQKKYKIPDYIQASCMAILGQEVALNDADISIVGTGPSQDKYGYIRGVLSDTGEVTNTDDRWFSKGENYFHFSFFMKGSFIYIPYQPVQGLSNGYQMVIYDWSDKKNPKFIQTLTTHPIFTKESVYKDLLLNENILYRFNGTNYAKIAELPASIFPKAISSELIFGCQSNRLVAYDISDPSKIAQVNVPVKKSVSYSLIYPFGNYLLQADGETKVQSTLAIVDAVEPSDMKVVGDIPLQGTLCNNMQLHHSLFSVIVKNPTPETIAYSFQKDSPVGTRIVTPPLLQDKKIAGYGDALFNDKLYIQGYNYPIPDGYSTPPPVYQRLYIYRRDGDQINQEPSSTLQLGLSDYFVQLSDTLLIASNFKANDKGVNYNYINLYSLDNPERPVLLTKYTIPSESSYHTFMFMRNIVLGSKTIAYILSPMSYKSFPINFIDIHDPLNPKYQSVPASLTANDYVMNIQWYKDLLLVMTRSEVIFYQMDSQGNWKELTRMQSGPNGSMAADGNHLYFSKNNSGIDTYQLKFNDTGIVHWSRF